MTDQGVVRAARGSLLSCRGWQQEGALRMLMNNLDPEVAERPQDLVVYGGRGKAARNWDCFHALVRSLRALHDDETLLVQSGKPVGVFRTHEYAPRVLIANSNLVGKWAGLSAALWAVALLLGLALLALLELRGFSGHGRAVTEAVYLAGLELTVVTSLAVLFSALSTPVLSALYTLALYVVGQWSYDLRGFAARFPEPLSSLLETIANLVPNLPLFNMRALAAAGSTTSGWHLGMATAYAAVYAGCVLALAAAAFEKRDFR